MHNEPLDFVDPSGFVDTTISDSGALSQGGVWETTTPHSDWQGTWDLPSPGLPQGPMGTGATQASNLPSGSISIAQTVMAVASIGAQVVDVLLKNPPAPHAQGQAQARAPQSHGSLRTKSPTNNPTNPSTLDQGFLTWDPGQVPDDGPVPGAADASDTPQAFAPKAGGPVMNDAGFKGNPEDAVFWQDVGEYGAILIPGLGEEQAAAALFRLAARKWFARAAEKVAAKAASNIGKQVAKLEKQLASHGRGSLERSLQSLEGRLSKHRQAIETYRQQGGYTSSVEREIRAFENEMRAIKEVLGRTP